MSIYPFIHSQTEKAWDRLSALSTFREVGHAVGMPSAALCIWPFSSLDSPPSYCKWNRTFCAHWLAFTVVRKMQVSEVAVKTLPCPPILLPTQNISNSCNEGARIMPSVRDIFWNLLLWWGFWSFSQETFLSGSCSPMLSVCFEQQHILQLLQNNVKLF